MGDWTEIKTKLGRLSAADKIGSTSSSADETMTIAQGDTLTNRKRPHSQSSLSSGSGGGGGGNRKNEYSFYKEIDILTEETFVRNFVLAAIQLLHQVKGLKNTIHHCTRMNSQKLMIMDQIELKNNYPILTDINSINSTPSGLSNLSKGNNAKSRSRSVFTAGSGTMGIGMGVGGESTTPDYTGTAHHNKRSSMTNSRRTSKTTSMASMAGGGAGGGGGLPAIPSFKGARRKSMSYSVSSKNTPRKRTSLSGSVDMTQSSSSGPKMGPKTTDSTGFGLGLGNQNQNSLEGANISPISPLIRGDNMDRGRGRTKSGNKSGNSSDAGDGDDDSWSM